MHRNGLSTTVEIEGPERKEKKGKKGEKKGEGAI